VVLLFFSNAFRVQVTSSNLVRASVPSLGDQCQESDPIPSCHKAIDGMVGFRRLTWPARMCPVADSKSDSKPVHRGPT
jgi:hypothetical protein